MRALELVLFVIDRYQDISFNPFMPNAGVGILSRELGTSLLSRFNPFMPNAGVGISGELVYDSGYNKFQSIYAQCGRWNF